MNIKLLTFVFVLFSLNLFAQEKVSLDYSDVALVKVFQDIEEKFDIKFSYNSDLINNKTISLNIENATLDEILLILEEKATVVFRKQSRRYYTVKPRKTRITDTQQLQEVLIKEYLTTGISKKKDDASISLLPNKLGILPGLTEPDVLQSIQLLPGVQSPTETASGLYIRGGTPDQNLILWDGIKMYHSGHFFGTISAFNPYITEEIKLYKSGTRAKYGNRISGVIDITSDNDIPNKIEGGAGLNMTHADIYLKAPISNQAAIITSARRSITDIFDTETFRNLSKRVFQETKISEGNKVFEDDEVLTTKDVFNFRDFTIKALVKPNKNNQLSVSTLFTNNKLDYGFLIEEFDEASNDKLEITNQGSSLNWKHNFNNSFSHDFNAYYSKFDLEYVGGNSITDEFSDELRKLNTIDDFGFSYNTNLKLNEPTTLGVGYEFSSNKVNYGLSFTDSESPEEDFNESNENTNNTHALYLDYQYKRSNKWLLNAGLRTNYFSVLNQFFVEPRVQFETRLSSSLKYKVSGETLHQAVSQVVEFNTQEFGLEDQIWVLSEDGEIPVLKSKQFTSGFIFGKRGWNIDIEAYYKKINGLTSYTLGFEISDNFFSKGESEVFGMDVLIKKRIQNYRTWLSYSYVNNDFSFDYINSGEEFSGNSDITHQLTWSHTYEWNHFNVSLGWNIRTGIPYTKATGIIDTPDGPQIEYDEVNGARLPDYHRLDLSTTYTFNVSNKDNWKGKIGFSILNIYNKSNLLSRTYERRQGASNEDALREVNKSSIGITPNLLFRMDF
ncbi:TonB-dependent receptor domain-containing protein [Seonamhaeicola aphaedonensis]|uniref:Outer membrane receptor for ferrienterochelin and colicin n=1 Tax=Seonamhaeicola aphaedonensis TaxID=1461338 RepID=A0A3D9HHP6_9FLAO|nr:TonB-dependent receptor [Seonamhaeicola aphaedonensis]RED48964.1 outer membrane receptor for ferrienterochelin and colicin [Seonamhaeicola aphaedonensis]